MAVAGYNSCILSVVYILRKDDTANLSILRSLHFVKLKNNYHQVKIENNYSPAKDFS